MSAISKQISVLREKRLRVFEDWQTMFEIEEKRQENVGDSVYFTSPSAAPSSIKDDQTDISVLSEPTSKKLRLTQE